VKDLIYLFILKVYTRCYRTQTETDRPDTGSIYTVSRKKWPTVVAE